MSDGTVDLGTFEGRDVRRSQIKVTKAGDGLSQAVKVDPILLHSGERVYVVLECEVGPISFPPLDDNGCARVQTLVTQAATIMDPDVVRSAIDEQKQRIQTYEAAQKGVRELPTSEALAREHRAGLHDGDEPDEHPACPECNPDTYEDHVDVEGEA